MEVSKVTVLDSSPTVITIDLSSSKAVILYTSATPVTTAAAGVIVKSRARKFPACSSTTSLNAVYSVTYSKLPSTSKTSVSPTCVTVMSSACSSLTSLPSTVSV